MPEIGGFFVSLTWCALKKEKHIMSKSKISVRVNRKNKNHHLWNNNGKWWAHLTVHHPDYTSERKRIPLDTRDVETARKLRDELFLNWTGKVLQQAA